jgi:hypothetical protein
MAQRRLGVKQIMIDGEVVDVKGGVEYSLGPDKLETIMGVDRAHGVKVTRQMAYVAFQITDRQGLNVKKLQALRDSTVTVALELGKTLKFGHAYHAAEGKVTAAEGEIDARFECDPNDAEEL